MVTSLTGHLPNRIITRCYLCGGSSLELLTQLAGGQSVTTDGQLLSAPLQKYQCLDCALVQSEPTTILNAATFSYEATYDFYAKPEMRAFERDRYRNYANWVASFLDQCGPRKVLEVGCGDGWVLELLRPSYSSISLQGLEPSAAATRRANDAGLDVQQGSMDNPPFRAGSFDFVYCVNVLEHVVDPLAFLTQIQSLLTPEGAALIICPCANVVDPELLFADHLFSYSRDNLKRLARLGGLIPTAWQQGSEMLFPFQALFCNATSARVPVDGNVDNNGFTSAWPEAGLPSARRDYFRRWAALDDMLLERLAAAGDVVCFGAGETSDLLRAHAPRCWEAVRGFMIDRPNGVDPKGQPKPAAGLQVRFTGDYRADEFGGILLGVKPRYQATISDRLRIFGKPVVRWDDVIPEPFI